LVEKRRREPDQEFMHQRIGIFPGRVKHQITMADLGELGHIERRDVPHAVQANSPEGLQGEAFPVVVVPAFDRRFAVAVEQLVDSFGYPATRVVRAGGSNGG